VGGGVGVAFRALKNARTSRKSYGAGKKNADRDSESEVEDATTNLEVQSG